MINGIISWSRWTVACVLALVLVSCEQDSYDKGNGDYSQMVAEMGLAYTESDVRVQRILTDDGEAYQVAHPFKSSLMPKADTVYRAIFYYNKTEDGVDVLGLNNVYVLSPRKLSVVKTDPVRLESVWMGKSKSYLNLSLYVMMGATSDKDAVHHFSCHKDTVIVHDNGKRTCHLTLYHDQAGIPEYYSQRTYFSIPVQGLQADTVSITVNTYDGLMQKNYPMGL